MGKWGTREPKVLDGFGYLDFENSNWTINSLGHTFIQRLDIAHIEQTFQSHKAQKAQKRMFVVFVVVVVSCRQG